MKEKVWEALLYVQLIANLTFFSIIDNLQLETEFKVMMAGSPRTHKILAAWQLAHIYGNLHAMFT